MSEQSLQELAVSYHTGADQVFLNVLTTQLKVRRVILKRLDYLTIYGFSSPEGLAGGQPRLDGWIDNFASILDGSLGMLVLQSPDSIASQTTPERGMWVERKLIEHIHPMLEDVIRVVETPTIQDAGSSLTMDAWATGVARDISDWVQRRLKSGIRVNFRRYPSSEVNASGMLSNHEIQYSMMGLYWYRLSILDLYDRVWHCRSCLASSDVWISIESRPPARCPACGFDKKA